MSDIYDNERPLDSEEARERIRQSLLKLFQEFQKLYGIQPHNRAKIEEIPNIINHLLDQNYSFYEIERGARQACLDSPKFLPRAFEFEVAIKNFINSHQNVKIVPVSDQKEKDISEQTHRREMTRKRLEKDFNQPEINEMVYQYCSKMGWQYHEWAFEDFCADIYRKESIALPIIKAMKAKHENTKRKSEGKKTPTMGERKAD